MNGKEKNELTTNRERVNELLQIIELQKNETIIDYDFIEYLKNKIIEIVKNY